MWEPKRRSSLLVSEHCLLAMLPSPLLVPGLCDMRILSYLCVWSDLWVCHWRGVALLIVLYTTNLASREVLRLVRNVEDSATVVHILSLANSAVVTTWQWQGVLGE